MSFWGYKKYIPYFISQTPSSKLHRGTGCSSPSHMGGYLLEVLLIWESYYLAVYIRGPFIFAYSHLEVKGT